MINSIILVEYKPPHHNNVCPPPPPPLHPPLPSSPPSKSGLKLVGNINIVYGILNSVNSQLPKTSTKLYVHEFGFRGVLTPSVLPTLCYFFLLNFRRKKNFL